MSKLLEIASQAQSETTDALQHAQNAQEIINALICNEGKPPIPSLADLQNFTVTAANDEDWHVAPIDNRYAVYSSKKRAKTLHNSALDAVKNFLKSDEAVEFFKLTPDERVKYYENLITNSKQKTDRASQRETFKAISNHISGTAGEPTEDRLIWIHQAWIEARKDDPQLSHPFAPLVRAWLQANPPKVEIENRPKQITPAFIKDSRTTTGERLPTGFLHAQGNTTTQLQLPLFEGMEDDIVVHALPIEIYQGGRGARGAPLDERIFFNALLARPYGKTEPFNAVRLEPTLRDYVDWLYPNGWQRNNQLPLLQKALYDVHNKRISYERRDWNIVQVLAMPNKTTKMDDLLPLIIRYPDGVQGNGPMIDVHRMRQYGLLSAPKWRAWIRLHYLWDTAKQRNGGYPIYATIPKVKRNDQGYLLDAKGDIIMTGDPYKNKKGRWAVQKGNKPQKAWYHPYAIHLGDDRNPQCDKIPVLADRQLVALFFDSKPVDKSTFRKRLHDSIDNLMDFEADGVVVVERDATDTKRGIKGWRIIPVFLDNPRLYNR